MTITTIEQLNALPVGTIITDRNGNPWHTIRAPFQGVAWLYRWPDNPHHTYAHDALEHAPFEIADTPHYRKD